MTQNLETIENALARRRQFFETCTAFRICHHELGQGLTIDYYAGYVLLIYYANFPRKDLAAIAAHTVAALTAAGLPVYGAIQRFRPENLSHARETAVAALQSDLLFGTLPPPRFVIREYDLQFTVSFQEGHNTGLFLDIKRARQKIKTIVKPGDEVLNLFSYTGGFSMAAAKAGAGRVIEVDSSPKWLNWAKENQALNGVTVVRQRREDALTFLHKQKDEAFNLIICDPPTYATQKSGSRFTLEKSFKEMLPDLARVLRPAGYLLASTNFRGISREKFFSLFAREFNLQEDVPISADFADDDYLKIGLFQKNRSRAF
ncbi:class I SAM-dependent rRNA methyltransferase [candidate division KSB1 bacterium]|nr:class I SAM-dependent rRNA methyltransferase [candidate division KSB1 bacterium]